MSQMGHSRPMHSVPVPINVRCYSNGDMIVRHSQVMLRATSGHPRDVHFIPESVETAGLHQRSLPSPC